MDKKNNIQIVVGTVMGTALDAAHKAEKILSQNYSVNLNLNFSAGDLDQSDVILVCTSNTGVGDIPQNLQAFYLHLVQDFPKIAGKSYAIINLGDSSYPSFGEAGQKIDFALSDIGAIRIVDQLLLDASEDYNLNEKLNNWLISWASIR